MWLLVQIISFACFLSAVWRRSVFRMFSNGRFHCNYKINYDSLNSNIYQLDLLIFQNLVQKDFKIYTMEQLKEAFNDRK